MPLPAIIAGEIITSLAASAIGDAFGKSKKGEDANLNQTYSKLNDKLEEQFQEFPKETPITHSTPIDERLSELRSTFSTHRGNLESAVEQSSLQMMRGIYEVNDQVTDQLSQMNKRLEILNQNLMATSQMVKTYGTANVEATAQFGNPKRGFLSSLGNGVTSTVGKFIVGLGTALGLGVMGVSALWNTVKTAVNDYLTPPSEGFPVSDTLNAEFSGLDSEIDTEIESAQQRIEEAKRKRDQQKEYDKKWSELGVDKMTSIRAINNINPESEEAALIRSFINNGEVTADERSYIVSRGQVASWDDNQNIKALIGFLLEDYKKDFKSDIEERERLIRELNEYTESHLTTGINPNDIAIFNERIEILNEKLGDFDDLTALYEALSGLRRSDDDFMGHIVGESSTYAESGEGFFGSSRYTKSLEEDIRKAESDLENWEEARKNSTSLKAFIEMSRMFEFMSDIYNPDGSINPQSELLKSFDAIGLQGNKASDGLKWLLETAERVSQMEDLDMKEEYERFWGVGSRIPDEGTPGRALYDAISSAIQQYSEKYGVDLTSQDSNDRKKWVDRGMLNENGSLNLMGFLKWTQTNGMDDKWWLESPYAWSVYTSLRDPNSQTPMILFDPSGQRVTDDEIFRSFAVKSPSLLDQGYSFSTLGNEDFIKYLNDIGYGGSEYYDQYAVWDEIANRVSEVLSGEGVSLKPEDFSQLVSDIYYGQYYSTDNVLTAVATLAQSGRVEYVQVGSNSVSTDTD